MQTRTERTREALWTSSSTKACSTRSLPRFNAADVAESAEAALEWSAQTAGPGVIVLDHGLAGALTGLTAAQRLRELAPLAKIILFTAHAELKALADEEPAIDAFLLKTDSSQLLPLAQRLTGLGALPT